MAEAAVAASSAAGQIIQALGLLKQAHQLKIPVVFCGSYWAFAKPVMRMMKRRSQNIGQNS
jgi:hypothetical protein